MSNQSIDELVSIFTKANNKFENSSGSHRGRFYPFWKMNFEEEAIVRFLPDKNEQNPLKFMVEKVVHRIPLNGKTETVPCMSMYGMDCPICEKSQEFYRIEGKQSKNGSTYWKKKSHIIQAFIIKDPLPVDPETGTNSAGTVKLLDFGYQLYTALSVGVQSGDLQAIPYDFHAGHNFIIKKMNLNGQGKYDVASRFDRNVTALTEEQIAYCQQHMIDLREALPEQPDINVVIEKLECSVTGRPYMENSTQSTSPDAAYSVQQHNVHQPQVAITQVQTEVPVQPQGAPTQQPVQPVQPVQTEIVQPQTAVTQEQSVPAQQSQEVQPQTVTPEQVVQPQTTVPTNSTEFENEADAILAMIQQRKQQQQQ